jgi:hypothetical protein
MIKTLLVLSSMLICSCISGSIARLDSGSGEFEARKRFHGDLKSSGVQQLVVLSDEGGQAAVTVMSTDSDKSTVEWSKEYNRSGAFPSASFVTPSGLYPIVRSGKLDIVTFLSLSGSAGGILEVFSWNGSTFQSIGQWGGNSTHQVYRVKILSENNEGVAVLAVHSRENGQYVMPTIYRWSGTVQHGKFIKANYDYPGFYAPLVEGEISNLQRPGDWWPDAFVQVLSRIVEGDAYRSAFAHAAEACRAILARVETEPSAKPQSAAEFERDKARAKADIYLLIGATQQLAGKKEEAAESLSMAKFANQEEYNYQIVQVKRFVRTRFGAPLLVRLD